MAMFDTESIKNLADESRDFITILKEKNKSVDFLHFVLPAVIFHPDHYVGSRDPEARPPPREAR